MKRIFVMQRPYRTEVSLRDMKRIFVMQRPYLLSNALLELKQSTTRPKTMPSTQTLQVSMFYQTMLLMVRTNAE